ncbi:MAG: inorganic phosphate transporter [Nitrososphaerota archaeon]|jgi:phosphate/sulfate permease|nr:inorganic phosphate transporter [Nitrososphaerota archaeon]MDG6960658.1 inorganic phosphate transporter [Nitrososphaerota archaeon]
MDSLLIGLAAVLSFVFGWNNSSLLIGNVRGSGTLSRGTIVTLAVVGLFLGSVLEGPKMVGSLTSLAPSASFAALAATIVVSLVLTAAMTMLDLPVSFSMVMVGAFMGATLASALALNGYRVSEVVAFWFLAPLGTGILTYAIYTLARRLTLSLGILGVDTLNKAGSLISAFAASYTLGANNIGMFYGSLGASTSLGAQTGIFVLLAVAATVGVAVLGQNSLGGVVGDRMLTLSPQGVFSAFISSSLLVWAGTQLALPVSITQCLIGGMLGAAFSRNVTIVNTRLVAETVSLWVVAPVVALAAAFLLTLAL